MGAGVDAWMPLFIGDALADTYGQSLEVRGAYVWLNMHLWKMGGQAEFKPTLLARFIGVDMPTWERVWPALEPLYAIEDGMIRSLRITEQRIKAETEFAKRSEQRKAAVKKRWDTSRIRPVCEPNTGDIRADTSPSPSPASKPTATPAKATTPRAPRSEGEADLALADRMRASVKDAQPTWTDPVWKRERERYAKAIRLARESDGRSPEMLAELCARWGELPQQARAWCETHPMDWKRDVAKLHGMLNGQQRPTDSRRGVLYTGTDAEFEEMARKYGRADG